MSAYVVMIRQRTLDQKEMDIYAQQALSAREGHPITPLARYGALEVLEGPAIEGCLIHQFPTMQDAERWYTARLTRQRRSIARKALSIRSLSLRESRAARSIELQAGAAANIRTVQ